MTTPGVRAVKKHILTWGMLIAIGLAILGYAYLSPGPGANLWNYSQIEIGMHVEEVESLLGGPKHGPQWRGAGIPIRMPNQGWIDCWQGDRGQILLVYDKEGFVADKEWKWQNREPMTWNDLVHLFRRREKIRE